MIIDLYEFNTLRIKILNICSDLLFSFTRFCIYSFYIGNNLRTKTNHPVQMIK